MFSQEMVERKKENKTALHTPRPNDVFKKNLKKGYLHILKNILEYRVTEMKAFKCC